MIASRSSIVFDVELEMTYWLGAFCDWMKMVASERNLLGIMKATESAMAVTVKKVPRIHQRRRMRIGIILRYIADKSSLRSGMSITSGVVQLAGGDRRGCCRVGKSIDD